MPDMRLNTALNVTNDLKTRPATEGAGTEMSSSQFLEMMMSKLTAMGNQDDELKTLLGRVAEKGGTNKADNDALLSHLKKMHEKNAVERQERAEPVKKAEVKEKIKAKVKEIAESDTTPVKDTRAMKALQKVAKFLVKASEEGSIELPPEMVQKLQEFLAKGDDLRAFDMASFMAEFTDMFKTMTVNMGAETGDLQWPQDIQASFEELGMKAFGNSDGKPLDMMQVMRAVKSLVNQSEKAAMDTLNDKANAAVAAQQNAGALLAGTGVKTDAKANMSMGATTTQDLPMTAMGLPTADTAAQQAAPTLTQTAKTSQAKTKEDASANKTVDVSSRPVSAEAAAKATAQTSQGGGTSLAAEVKAVFTVAAPAGADASAAHIMKADAIAAPGSLAAKTATATAEMMRETARPNVVTQQVIAQIQSKGTGETKISVQLSPAELGRVEVRLTIGKDGQAHAVVVADKPETLALLQKDASHLERSLQQAGINANAGSMSFNLRDQQQAQQFGQGRKRFSRSEIGDVSTKEVSMNVLAEAAIISDTRINYHA